MSTAVKLVISGFISIVCLIVYFALKHRSSADSENKKSKKLSKLFFALVIIASWFFAASVFSIVKKAEGISHLKVEMFSPRSDILGISLADTTITMFCVTGIIFVLALIFRFVVFPRFSEDKPRGFQTAVETMIDFFDNYTHSKVHGNTGWLSSYLMSISVLMFGCAMAELFSLRPPTSDILITFSMGLITFFLINWYGIKQKKLSGRIKSLASPSPIIFPMRIISDIAVPVSLACRLFGNMLGGMIVMDLLKHAAGAYSLGIAPVAGLYFNLFHPIIQIYIFITLSLTFINEATE